MQNRLDFIESDAHAGFRLERFEFFNWGTFDERVWTITPQGDNALLTGDIGSGKSTIVDALTTLLVPPQRITYNKAAGAESRERSLRSYVMGHYKSEKDGERLSAKAVSLRDHRHYSVLLAHFINRGYGQCVTLAQVFWTGEGKSQPERFHLVADTDMSIKDAFGDFAGDIRHLKRRLRDRPSVELFESFNQYAAVFRRKLGIGNSKAMDLFYQTVSMKSVGNLTEFVRSHMLEPGDFEEKVRDICRNFDNLNQAHEAVLQAKRQIAMLTPLAADAEQHQRLDGERQHMQTCRDALHAYFAQIKAQLLRIRLQERRQEFTRVQNRLTQQRASLEHLRDQETKLHQSISDNGGRRLDEIAREVDRLTEHRRRIQTSCDKYTQLCKQLELSPPADDQQFYANRNKTESAFEALKEQRNHLEVTHVDAEVSFRKLKEQHDELDSEVQSLAARQSNIPRRNLDLRRQMCQSLGVPDDDLPFVGELIQVRADQHRWHGAAERLLHQFGLSLIVPEALYAEVSRYVDQTHLQGRVVYYRVRAAQPATRRKEDDNPALLWRKLEIKPDSEHYAWLEDQLAHRFDYECSDDLETFRRLPKAVTAQGQVKSGGERHEKDDRFRIDDPSRYILGWNNQQKIAALKRQQEQIASEGRKHFDQAKTLTQQLETLGHQRDAMRDLLAIEHYHDIHWQAVAVQIDALETERKEIEASHDILKTLRHQLMTITAQIKSAQESEARLLRESGSLNTQIELDEAALAVAQKVANEVEATERDTLFPQLDQMQSQASVDEQLTIQNCDANQTHMRSWLQDMIDACSNRMSSLHGKIVRQMQEYKNAYPLATREIDASLEAIREYREMLHHLMQEDLPRHESRFKELLNQGTIQEIALLQSQLEKEARDIEEKINQINESLRQIDYNPGTYIRLGHERGVDQEIREFQASLRSCMGDTLAGATDEIYTEQKFIQVKALIDRFNGREGLSEADRRWTAKVTDVRNWFEFFASERWREDDTEREFYSDSAGKSGGQKEKLAYTILASALAYQFGLKVGETRSRSFRFVMIDEAFGRGSDESARYGLDVFKKLNLQLLIITPLQKIHIIEDYVQSVHFVHNEDGQHSQLRNLTITAYREEKQRFAQPQITEDSSL